MDRHLTIEWKTQIERPDWDAIKHQPWCSPAARYMESKQGSLVGQCDDPALLSPIITGHPKRDGYTIFEFVCPLDWDEDVAIFNGVSVGKVQMTHVPPGGILPSVAAPKAGDGFNVIVGHVLVPTGDEWLEGAFAALGRSTFPGRKEVRSTAPVPEGFQVKIEGLPDASFYPEGIRPGMLAVAIRHPSGPWTTAAYSSVEAMDRLPIFDAYVVDDVMIHLAVTTVKGTTTSIRGLLRWTKPAMAYAANVEVMELGRDTGARGSVTYLLPKPGTVEVKEKAVTTYTTYEKMQDDAILDAMRNWSGPAKGRGKNIGAPKLRALSDAVGFKVDRARRNRLWQIER